MRIFVPGNAVRSVGGETIVWVVRNGTVSPVTVDAGPVSGGRREVRSGLSGGEQVVVDPPAGHQPGVTDGAGVRTGREGAGGNPRCRQGISAGFPAH
jgi:multidrug efflux pump subunit AcrA (membrane-fusion protein)